MAAFISHGDAQPPLLNTGADRISGRMGPRDKPEDDGRL